MAKKKENIENNGVVEESVEKKTTDTMDKASENETVQARFQEKLRDLLALAKKKKNMLRK